MERELPVTRRFSGPLYNELTSHNNVERLVTYLANAYRYQLGYPKFIVSISERFFNGKLLSAKQIRISWKILNEKEKHEAH